MEERKCVSCGKAFIPNHEEDNCCSPFCRSIYRAQCFDAQKEQETSRHKAEIESLTRPPPFDLESNPKARVEWFMGLEDIYKPKFSRFLTDKELEWARSMAQANLAEEKYYTGYYVKNGRIVEPKKETVPSDNAQEVVEENE